MARPTDDPAIWSSDVNFPAGADSWNATPTKVDPGSAQVAAGHEPEDMPPAQWLNWLLNNHGQWIDFSRKQSAGVAAANLRAVSVGVAMRGVAYATGVIAAGGANKTLYTSADGGDSWTSRTLPAGLGGSAICNKLIHDGTEYIYVGDTGGNWIATSTDGTTWTDRSPTGTDGVNSVAYDGSGTYVAVGNTGKIWSSADAHTWTARTAADSYVLPFESVVFGAGLFVAVGTLGGIQTSPDGTTWTTRTPDASYAGLFAGVGYDGQNFMAVGGGPEVQTSADGITWAQSATPPASFTVLSDGTYAPGLGVWVITTGDGPYMAFDPTGEWTLVESAIDGATILSGRQINEGGGGLLIASQDGTDSLLMSLRTIA